MLFFREKKNAIVLLKQNIVTKCFSCLFFFFLWVHAGNNVWLAAGHQWDWSSCDTSQNGANESLLHPGQFYSWHTNDTLLGPTKGCIVPSQEENWYVFTADQIKPIDKNKKSDSYTKLPKVCLLENLRHFTWYVMGVFFCATFVLLPLTLKKT